MKHLAHLLNRTQPVQGPVVRARQLSAWVGGIQGGNGTESSSFATRTITTMDGMVPGEGSA